MSHLYTIEVHKHGWLVCGVNEPSLPISEVSDIAAMYPGKDAVMHTGIAHHHQVTGRHNVVLAITTMKNVAKWEAEIAKSIAHLPPEHQWWVGTDVGTSSAAMFAVLAQDGVPKTDAYGYGRQSTPRDAADFGRCHRLLNLFPNWRARLHEVSEAYPDTKWPQIIELWDELESAAPITQSQILRRL